MERRELGIFDVTPMIPALAVPVCWLSSQRTAQSPPSLHAGAPLAQWGGAPKRVLLTQSLGRWWPGLREQGT